MGQCCCSNMIKNDDTNTIHIYHHKREPSTQLEFSQKLARISTTKYGSNMSLSECSPANVNDTTLEKQTADNTLIHTIPEKCETNIVEEVESLRTADPDYNISTYRSCQQSKFATGRENKNNTNDKNMFNIEVFNCKVDDSGENMRRMGSLKNGNVINDPLNLANMSTKELKNHVFS